ncbi:MAG: helix-turn-helix domain-containing protein [Alphaproteobacteria bacterium]|nr:helix-turn-helix domain-containing protein [Alphaproteobacteria bacterium]MCB9795697.1 helix-turn-helix domain-containing protein [Alphaproteobacteria bacterium]
MITLTLDEEGRLQLPEGLRSSNAWGPGTRFGCEESHGVLVLRALPPEPPERVGVPRDADEIVALRIQLGLTRSSFARRLGVDVQHVRDWEEGQADPDEAQLRTLALLASDE